MTATMTTRPTTTAEKPIRIRLTRRQADRYRRLLGDDRHRLVIDRAVQKGHGHSVSELNREIEEIERMQEELARAASERGWLD